MPNKFRRKKLSYLIHTALMSSLVAPVIAQAQDDEVEEIVVTGSYIRNSAFSQDTAADTVTGADLLSIRHAEHVGIHTRAELCSER